MVESLVVALATNYKSAKSGASASRRAKRKRVTQQDGNSAPLKKTKKKFLPQIFQCVRIEKSYEKKQKVVNALGKKKRPEFLKSCQWMKS